MRARIRMTGFFAALLAVGATASGASAQGSAPAPGPAATPPPAVAPKEPEAGPPLPPKAYDAKQRRDPFKTLSAVEGTRRGFSVSALKLVGMIQGRKGPLALVEAPDGLGYILKVDDVLGDGRVSEIGAGTVTFDVTGKPGQKPATVTLRLSLE